MTENKHYLVSYSIGAYEDKVVINLFVTESEEYAKKYCDKFNSIRDKWFEYFYDIVHNCDIDNENYNPQKWSKANNFIEINTCFYNEIEMR